MTQYKHYPYNSWIEWVVKPRQSHMVDSMERRPQAFEGPKGRELAERFKMIKVWLTVRAAVIVLLFFSVIVTIVTWTIRVLGGVPGGAEVLAAVEMASTVTSATSGLLGLVYLITLRTLGQLEMDAILLFPANRADWGEDESKPESAAPAPDTRGHRASFAWAPRRARD